MDEWRERWIDTRQFSIRQEIIQSRDFWFKGQKDNFDVIGNQGKSTTKNDKLFQLLLCQIHINNIKLTGWGDRNRALQSESTPKRLEIRR